MSNTLTRPRTVVAILAAGALIAVGVLLLVGVFASDDATKTTGTEGIVVAPTSGGINKANAQRLERQLQHGVVPGQALQESRIGDTKNDLPAASPAAGRFLATPVKPVGDTKSDLPCGSSLSNRCVAERAPGAGH